MLSWSPSLGVTRGHEVDTTLRHLNFASVWWLEVLRGTVYRGFVSQDYVHRSIDLKWMKVLQSYSWVLSRLTDNEFWYGSSISGVTWHGIYVNSLTKDVTGSWLTTVIGYFDSQYEWHSVSLVVDWCSKQSSCLALLGYYVSDLKSLVIIMSSVRSRKLLRRYTIYSVV